jgi:hypothetical protein
MAAQHSFTERGPSDLTPSLTAPAEQSGVAISVTSQLAAYSQRTGDPAPLREMLDPLTTEAGTESTSVPAVPEKPVTLHVVGSGPFGPLDIGPIEVKPTVTGNRPSGADTSEAGPGDRAHRKKSVLGISHEIETDFAPAGLGGQVWLQATRAYQSGWETVTGAAETDNNRGDPTQAKRSSGSSIASNEVAVEVAQQEEPRADKPGVKEIGRYFLDSARRGLARTGEAAQAEIARKALDRRNRREQAAARQATSDALLEDPGTSENARAAFRALMQLSSMRKIGIMPTAYINTDVLAKHKKTLHDNGLDIDAEGYLVRIPGYDARRPQRPRGDQWPYKDPGYPITPR